MVHSIGLLVWRTHPGSSYIFTYIFGVFDLYTGDPLLIAIDLFQFTPGPHVLTISFVLTDGTKGEDFQFDFTRPTPDLLGMNYICIVCYT